MTRGLVTLTALLAVALFSSAAATDVKRSEGAASKPAAAAKPAPAKPALSGYDFMRSAWAAAVAPGGDDKPCRDKIGYKKAKAIAQLCLANSGASVPPCNTHNTCKLMTNDLFYGCIRQGGGRPGETLSSKPDPRFLPCQYDRERRYIEKTVLNLEVG